ncbi:choline transporter, partial [Vibrio anguillarum]|nr:choline transporter [Vibrio anguillarum]
YEDPVINIEDFPDVDPWSREGMALAKFERLKDEAMTAAEQERESLAAIWKLKKVIRLEALARGENGLELGEAPEDQLTEIQSLTEAVMAAREHKLQASEAAQAARIEFNELLKEKEQ